MPARLSIADLPFRYQDQIAAQLAAPKPAKAPVAMESPAPRLRQKRRGSASKLQLDFLARLRIANAERIAKGRAAVLGEFLTLSLGNGVSYRPDAWAIHYGEGNGVRIASYEVKGPQYWAAARVKNKVAADLYPWIEFYLVRRAKSGEWEYDRILPKES